MNKVSRSVLWPIVLYGLIFVAPCDAQPPSPRIDVFGGYAASRSEGMTATGWDSEVGGRLKGPLYVVGEVTGSYTSVNLRAVSRAADPELSELTVRSGTYALLAGPRLFLRRHPVLSPFAHALVGGFANTEERTTASGRRIEVGDPPKGLALILGGGVDIGADDRFSFRVKPEYYLARDSGSSTHGFSFTLGIVFHASR